MIPAIGLILLLATMPAHAADNNSAWTGSDTALQLIFVTVTAADWAQTLHISRNPQTYYETNPHLGQHPTEGRVNSYFAATIALNTAVAYLLPKPWRTGWQAFWIGYEYGFVKRNIEIGLQLSF